MCVCVYVWTFGCVYVCIYVCARVLSNHKQYRNCVFFSGFQRRLDYILIYCIFRVHVNIYNC